MLKTYKYRISPTQKQKLLLEKHFGAVRFVYNLALETKTIAYSSIKYNISRYELQEQLRDLKEGYEWLKEINSQSLQFSLLNLDVAYTNFFKGRAKFPNFKNKYSSKHSFHCPQNIAIENGLITLPKFKEGIKIKLHRKFFGEIRNATVSKTSTNKYFVSILVDTKESTPDKLLIEKQTAVGIDMGVKIFATLSNGEDIPNSTFLKSSLQRLKVLQRRLSKKKKGSANRKKSTLKLAKQHEKIANRRKDFLHKTTNAITKQYNTVVIEDLNIKGMSAKCKSQKDENGKYIHNGQSAKTGLNRSILDAGWGMFAEFLKYKCEWRGKNFIQIGRFEPSSKIHNGCGYYNHSLTLQEREWICPKCGKLVDREKNAALNILDFGLNPKQKQKDSGVERTVEPVELPTMVRTVKQEKFMVKSCT